MRAGILILSFAALFAPVLSQSQTPIVYDTIHNATTLIGTWASGSKKVVTGSGFANPANLTFKIPPVSGISYTFDGDNNYEIARYRFTGNASDPTCIIGVLNWVHGKYSLQSNGSIILTPVYSDGYQQIQTSCNAQSSWIEDYNTTELIQQWRIFQDATAGYKLHLFQFDGAPLAPQFQVSTTPNMLPTRQLRNMTTSPDTNPNGIPGNQFSVGGAIAAATSSSLLVWWLIPLLSLAIGSAL